MKSPPQQKSGKQQPDAAGSVVAGSSMELAQCCASLFVEPARLVQAVRVGHEGTVYVQNHIHKDLLQLDVITGFSGYCTVGRQRYVMRPYTVLALYPGQKHGYELSVCRAGGEFYSCKIRVQREWAVVRQRLLEPITYACVQQQHLLTAVRQACQVMETQPCNKVLLASFFCELLGFWPQAGLTAPALPLEQVLGSDVSVRLAVQELERQVNRPPDLTTLSKQSHLSPRQLTRRFIQTLGCTPKSYLNRLRLVRAQTLLLQEAEDVKQVADQLGFGSVHHFTRWFAVHTGLPPGRYRDQGQWL